MKEKLRLAPNAAGAIMMAMQQGLKAAAEGRPKEECDITQILLGFELENTNGGLIVLNPPVLHYEDIVEVKEDLPN